MSSPSPSPLKPIDIPLPDPFQPDQPAPITTLSLSSTSSLESTLSDDYSRLFVPNKSRSFSSIPFSWEKLPGVPKLSNKIQDPSLNDLPLPPSTGTPTPSKKSYPHRNPRKDPFFAAFVECRKDDDSDDKNKGSTRILRSLSGRFGFVSMYSSCKRSCPVADSVIYVSKPQKHYLLN